ncbi:arylsulfotransferase family protein [Gordonia sp. DT101]
MILVFAGCGSGGDDTSSTTTAQKSTYTVNVNDVAGATGGYVFFNEGQTPASAIVGKRSVPGPGTGSKLVIADKEGRTVWSRTAPAGQSMANFRVQTLHGKPVLTWWQGSLESGQSGVDYIANDHYQTIATIDAGQTPGANIHDFRLSDDGHAWITVYQPMKADLTSVGGAEEATMYDAVVKEVDVHTGNVLVEWHASQHIPISDSYITPSDTVDNSGGVYDPYHLNSISLASDGNMILSMRHTSTIYEVDPTTGAVVWQLGGKRSSFTLGAGVQFSFQHNAEMQDAQTLRLFNNNTDGETTNGASSIEWIHLDTATRTATSVRNQTHPGGVKSAAMGNAQLLPNGNVFGSWGTGAHIAEFTPSGQMVYDATLAPAGAYRAFYQQWSGTPLDSPDITISDDKKTLHAHWNGATRVAKWRVLHSTTATDLAPVTTADWRGANTAITLPESASGYYEIEALDASGAVIGRSVPVSA